MPIRLDLSQTVTEATKSKTDTPTALEAIMHQGYYISPPDDRGYCEVISPKKNRYIASMYTCTCPDRRHRGSRTGEMCKHSKWVRTLWGDELRNRGHLI